MTSRAAFVPRRGEKLAMWGSVVLMSLMIWLDHRSPGSFPARLAFYAYTIYFIVLFGAKVRSGYRRRSPYWTREAWRRYLRLASMPIAALALFLTGAYLFDPSVGVFGSPAPIAGILILLGLSLFGAIGSVMALAWLIEGEPSEQFTRTRWFRRRRTSAIAD
jgi:hypothetical protein